MGAATPGGASRPAAWVVGAEAALGRALALHLAARGWRVAASGGTAALGELAAASQGAVVACPLAEGLPAARRAVATIQRIAGPLRLVVVAAPAGWRRASALIRVLGEAAEAAAGPAMGLQVVVAGDGGVPEAAARRLRAEMAAAGLDLRLARGTTDSSAAFAAAERLLAGLAGPDFEIALAPESPAAPRRRTGWRTGWRAWGRRWWARSCGRS